MDKKRMIYTTMGFGILLVVVMVLLAWGGRRQSGGIILPESQTDSAGLNEDDQSSRLHAVAVSPETASAAISYLTLSRPSSYSRTQQVETFWTGGSSAAQVQVWAASPPFRFPSAAPAPGWTPPCPTAACATRW